MRRSRKNSRFIVWALSAAVVFVLGLLAYTQTVNASVYQGEDGYSLYVSDTGSTVEEVFAASCHPSTTLYYYMEAGLQCRLV